MNCEERIVIIETPRLVLYELGVSDVKEYQRLIEVCKSGIDESLKGLNAEDFMKRFEAYVKYQYGFYGYGSWGIYLKNTADGNPTLIGIAGVVNGDESEVGEVSYALFPEYQGQGYGRESVKAVCEYALSEEIGFKRLYARIEANNIGSIRLAQSLGLEYRII